MTAPLRFDAYIGRQAILDRKGKIYAYELLFRDPDMRGPIGISGDVATSRVLHEALMEVGLDAVVGDKLAFINFPRELLIGGIADLMPPERVVVEILENIEIDAGLVASVGQLVEAGFVIALDDFVYSPAWDPLLELAAIVKLDVSAHSPEEIRALKRDLERFDVKFLAEKVETHEEHACFSEMGFSYFQGFYYARPQVLTQERLADNHVALLQLVARLQTPNIDIDEVADLVSQAVSLSYKLLRFINSAYTGLPRKVDSIREAVVYLGLKRLKDLASVMALSGISQKSDALVMNGITRARTCTLLGARAGLRQTEAFYLVGLFSILEALLDRRIEEILGQLPVSEEIVAALVAREGALGEALQASIACERCEWEQLGFRGLSRDEIYAAYREAMASADNALT